MELAAVISTVLKAIAPLAAKPIANQVQRSELLIKTLKACGLEPEHPKADFSHVYAYALVEYGLADNAAKSEELLQLFAKKEIKAAFRQAFDQWNLSPLSEAVEGEVTWANDDNAWNGVGNAIREQGIDVQKEIAVFFAVFVKVMRRSQTPKELLQSLMLRDVWQEVKQARAQLGQVSDFDVLSDKLMALFESRLQSMLPPAAAQTSGVKASLAEQLDAWFDVLGYGREEYRASEEKYFECVITIPVRRKRYDRVVVRGVEGEAGLSDLRALQDSVTAQKADEGWLVSNMRVSSGVRKAVEAEEDCEDLSCYTLDELLDEDADFSGYVAWLEEEITSRGIDRDYISLGCAKAEVDPRTKKLLGTSRYGEDEGWIENYNLHQGDIATLIDYVPHPEQGEEGAIVEVFNALGDTVSVVTVPISSIETLQPNDILSIRRLAEAS